MITSTGSSSSVIHATYSTCIHAYYFVLYCISVYFDGGYPAGLSTYILTVFLGMYCSQPVSPLTWLVTVSARLGIGPGPGNGLGGDFVCHRKVVLGILFMYTSFMDDGSCMCMDYSVLRTDC